MLTTTMLAIQFAYEDERLLDVVLQGHAEMWSAMQARDRIDADPDAVDDDWIRATERERKFAEYGSYTAGARAGSILIDASIDESQHKLPMHEIPPACPSCRRRRPDSAV